MLNKTVFSVYKGGKCRHLVCMCMQVRTHACMHASGLHAGVCGVCEGAQKGIARAHTVLEYPYRTARLLPRMLHTHARARRGGGGYHTSWRGSSGGGGGLGENRSRLGLGWAGRGGRGAAARRCHGEVDALAAVPA